MQQLAWIAVASALRSSAWLTQSSCPPHSRIAVTTRPGGGGGGGGSTPCSRGPPRRRMRQVLLLGWLRLAKLQLLALDARPVVYLGEGVVAGDKAPVLRL